MADIIDFATRVRLDAPPANGVRLFDERPGARAPFQISHAGPMQGAQVRVKATFVRGVVLGRHPRGAALLVLQDGGIKRWYMAEELELRSW